MDEREVFLAERNAVIRQQRIEREEAAERRESEARQVERQASTEAAMHARQLSGEPIPSVHDVLMRARGMFDATEDGRDVGAAYGSQSRPAQFVVLSDGTPAEVTARPAGVQRSASQIADDDLLRQARESSANSWMRVQIARAESRRRHRDAPVSRSADGDWERRSAATPEITRTVAYGDDGRLRNYGPEISR